MGNETNTTTATNDETSNVTDPQTETVTTTVATDETSETTTTNQQSFTEEEYKAQIKRMEAALQKANKDAKTHRLKADELATKASELEKFKAEVDAKNLSEQEKQELARKTLEQQLTETKKLYDDTVREKQEIRVKHAVQLQATKLGIDPSIAEKLIDWAEIDHDDDGNPKNIPALLTNLIKEYPYLKATQQRQTPTSGGATNPPRSTTTTAIPDKLTWEYVTQVVNDPAKFNALPQVEQKRITQWMAVNTKRR